MTEQRVKAGDRALEVLPHEFTKKPVTIWAVRYDGTVKSAHAICDWVGCAGARFGPKKYKQPGSPVWDGTLLQIRTLESGEGYHEVSEGDFVIKGVKGEFYPCKPDIFAATYSAGQSAMNAQERELDQLLPDSLNRPMSERIQGLKERADREANLAVELRDALKRLYGICRYASPHDDSMLTQWDSRIAEAERLLAERGQ